MKTATRKVIAIFAVFAFALVSAAEAGEFDDLMTKIKSARDALATMIQNKDKRGPDQQKLVKDTADAVSAALAKIKVPADKEGRFKTLVTTWNDFKKTREEKIVPALLAGRQDEAVQLASGIQAERLAKMIALCEELGY